MKHPELVYRSADSIVVGGHGVCFAFLFEVSLHFNVVYFLII